MGKDIECGMHLDFSANSLSDSSIRYFSEILRKFSGFRSIRMSDLSEKAKKKDTGFFELAKSLEWNTSLEVLDLRRN